MAQTNASTSVVIFTTISLVITAFSGSAFAGGVALDGSIGKVQVSIVNPDLSDAYYDGITLQGRLGIPLIQSANFVSRINFAMKYVDIQNRSNGSAQRETGNHIGPGAGLEVRIYRLLVGYNMYFMKARHFWVGDTSNSYSELDYQASGWFAGLEVPLGRMARVGLVYSDTSATFAAADVGLSKDVPYSEQTIWFQLKISTDQTIGGFFKSIFGVRSTNSR